MVPNWPSGIAGVQRRIPDRSSVHNRGEPLRASARGNHGKRLFRVHRPPGAVDAFAGDVREHDGTVSFGRVSDTDPETSTCFTSELAYREKPQRLTTLQAKLTEKQTAVYESALEPGYDDASVTVSDLADYVSPHRSTVGEHIKRVETRVLAETGRQTFTATAYPRE